MMAIVGLPGNIGSSAVSETGKRLMSEAMRDVRVAVPGLMSAMAGQSKEIYYSIGANHNYDKNTLINWMRAQGGAPVVITVTGDLVSNNCGNPCLEFPSDLPNAYIQLNINSGVTVYGRGGNGSTNGTAGQAGGTAIHNAAGTKLRIRNNGTIAGGGGGGGAVSLKNKYPPGASCGGGGGRPFGVGGKIGTDGTLSGSNASLTAAGTGGLPIQYSTGGLPIQYGAGNGGDVGAAGGLGWGRKVYTSAGGAAGAAVTGNAPSWQNLGTINGSRV